MKLNRLALIATTAVAAVTLAACAGNASRDSEAPVFLSQNIPVGPADVDISVPVDVTVPNMNIQSHAKSPTGTLSSQDDVTLTDWTITPGRTDGGTVASPVWHNFYSVYVPANGTANLQNYRIFPAEYFKQPPLNQLLPENGGFDKETGKRNIRQQLHIEVFGKTVAGDRVSLVFDVNLNFFYRTP
jgi:hypothetical protein